MTFSVVGIISAPIGALADARRRRMAAPPAQVAPNNAGAQTRWKTVKLAAKTQRATKEWWKPSYWGSVTGSGDEFYQMPLDKLAIWFLKRLPYYTIVYCVACIYHYMRPDQSEQYPFA